MHTLNRPRRPSCTATSPHWTTPRPPSGPLLLFTAPKLAAGSSFGRSTSALERPATSAASPALAPSASMPVLPPVAPPKSKSPKSEAMNLAAVSVESDIPEQRGKPQRASVNAALSYVNRVKGEGDRPATRGERPVTRGDRPVTRGERPTTKGERPVTKGERPGTRGAPPTARADERPGTRWEARLHDAFGVPSEEDAKLLPALPAVTNWKKKRQPGQASLMCAPFTTPVALPARWRSWAAARRFPFRLRPALLRRFPTPRWLPNATISPVQAGRGR